MKLNYFSNMRINIGEFSSKCFLRFTLKYRYCWDIPNGGKNKQEKCFIIVSNH